MGKIRPPEKAILFIAMLLKEQAILNKLNPLLVREFGEVLYETSLQDWNWSDYYREEMGEGLKRGFVFFKDPIDSSMLSKIKLKTNEMEKEFSIDRKRRVNLDPGYITLSKVVLASTKNYSHRIYLGKGIYAEITLYFRNGSFRPHLCTYRDYADPATLKIFNTVRGMIKDSLEVI